MDVTRYGENGLRVVFGRRITTETSERIRRFCARLSSLRPRGLVDIIPSFTTCLLIYDRDRTDFDALVSLIAAEERSLEQAETAPPRVHDIPVAYGGESGPDIGFVAAHCGLTEREVVEIHTATEYTVFAIGFLPGYPYLGPLSHRLETPRLETPRLRVPEGSVAIAQLQTGIYTFDSPGGWRIIGRTRKKLFDYERKPYNLLSTGDKVRFIPV